MNVRVLLALCIAAAGVAACASPREHYYSLMPDLTRTAPVAPGAPGAPGAPATTAPLRTVSVAAVTVPEAVNRPQLVIGGGEHERLLLEQERWIEPLAGDLQRAIAQHLSAALADTTVLVGDERGAEAAGLRLYVQVRRFELSPQSGARLDAHWTLVGRDGAAVHDADFSASARAVAKGYPALVSAQSKAVGMLAAQIAGVLQGLPVTAAAGR